MDDIYFSNKKDGAKDETTGMLLDTETDFTRNLVDSTAFGRDNRPLSCEQVGYLSSDASLESIVNPFERRSSILRSPPSRGRANSAPDLEHMRNTQKSKKQRVEESKETTANEQKRKREESPKMEKSKEQKQFLKILECLRRNVASLQEVVKSGYKVKTEIKEATGRLALCMQDLMRDDMRMWIHDATKTPPQDKGKCEGKVLKGAEWETQQDAEKETRDMATQTEYRERLNPNAARIGDKIAQVIDGKTYETDIEGVKHVIQEEWPKEAYKTCKIESGGVVKAAKVKDVAIFVDDKTEEGSPVIKQLSEIQPEVRAVIRRGSVQPGRVVYATSCNKIVDENEMLETNTRVMYLAGLGGNASEVETMIAVLRKIKTISGKEGRKEFVAVCAREGTENLLRKAIELVFGGEGYNIVLYTKKVRGETDRQKNDKDWQVQRRSSQRARRETILVKPTTEEKTYADLLREMKENIDMDKLDVKINNVEKTREGYVKLNIFRGKQGSGETVKAAVQERLKDVAEVHLKKRKKNIVILDLDDITTEEEVYDALKAEIQDLTRDDTVIKMSPKANSRGLQYANIQLAIEEANRLLGLQRIKVGWTRCRIVERLVPVKCYRCQNYGHYASSCNSEEDMSSKCLKCGHDGHKIKECENEPFCSACKKKGHTSSEMICPKYKELMAELRRKKVNRRAVNEN